MLFMSSNESGIGGGWYVLAAAVEPYIAGVQVASHQCHVDSDANSTTHVHLASLTHIIMFE